MEPGNSSTECVVIDIGGSKLHDYYLKALQTSFLECRKSVGHYVSDVFAFGNEGIELWSDVTSLQDWYQTREEIGLLKQWGNEIAKNVPPGGVIIDLGSGSDVKKITPLLDSIEVLQRPVTYYSVDLSRASIIRGLKQLSCRYKHITLAGLWGTFDDARKYVEKVEGPRFLACLGAEIGNDPFENAVSDVSSWATIMRPHDRFLLGIDSNQDKTKIWKAYHDSEGVFDRFIRTGMAHTNAVFGHEWFKDEDWILDGEIRDDPLVHRFVFTALRDVSCAAVGISFKQGDRVFCFESHRNTPAEMRKIFQASGLKEVSSWKSSDGDSYDFLLGVQK